MTTLSHEETIRALKNAYQREWRKRNPEKAKEHQRRYWERKAKAFIAEANSKKDPQ